MNAHYGFSGHAFDIDGHTTLRQNRATENRIGIGVYDGIDLIGNTVDHNDSDEIVIFDGSTMVTTIKWNNIYGNDRHPGVNCRLANLTDNTVNASQNYWGSPNGPGPDPADEACDGSGTLAPVTPFVPTPFPLPTVCAR
ncbi:hypothetical protein C2W62_18505 [Candidatus Entotheonella serta]|nr:hypothetical protein C2W62_18505 [Candidatus Entotheonella serta]